MSLLSCRACSGFLPLGHRVCPHCDAQVPRGRVALGRVARLATQVAAGSGLAMTLAACYGAPSIPDCDSVRDEDGDGYATYFVERRDVFGTTTEDSNCAVPLGSQPDCDDSDEAIHPDAVDDDNDGVDQNCDCVDGVAQEPTCKVACNEDAQCAEGQVCETFSATCVEAVAGEGEGEGEGQ